MIDGCCRLLLEHGGRDPTAENVAEAAGVSRATFYLHFGSVEALKAQLRGTMMAEFDRWYTSLAKIDGADLPAVRRWLTGLLAMCRQHRPLLLALMQRSSDSAAEFDTRRYYSAVIERLGERHSRFAAARDNPMVATRALLLLLAIESVIRICVAAAGSYRHEPLLIDAVAEDLYRFLTA